MNMLRRMWFGLMYLGKPPWDTGISPPELMQFITSHTPGRALDLGCGTGTNAITLASKGWQVTGIDFAGKAIHTARRKARQAGMEIDFRRGDVTQIKSSGGVFDLVLDIGCFHSLDGNSRQKYAANLPHLLARGGTFLLYAWIDEDEESGTGLGKADLEMLTEAKNARETPKEVTGKKVGFRSSTQPTNRDTAGVTPGMPPMKRHLRLVERQDGTERGARPSAWFTFVCEAG